MVQGGFNKILVLHRRITDGVPQRRSERCGNAASGPQRVPQAPNKQTIMHGEEGFCSRCCRCTMSSESMTDSPCALRFGSLFLGEGNFSPPLLSRRQPSSPCHFRPAHSHIETPCRHPPLTWSSSRRFGYTSPPAQLAHKPLFSFLRCWIRPQASTLSCSKIFGPSSDTQYALGRARSWCRLNLTKSFQGTSSIQTSGLFFVGVSGPYLIRLCFLTCQPC